MYVYILKSQIHPDTYYVGVTHNLKARLAKHNSGAVSHTSKYLPWKYENCFWFRDEAKARKFEKYLKSHSGRAFCKKHF